jgi:hypothetical protein
MMQYFDWLLKLTIRKSPFYLLLLPREIFTSSFFYIFSPVRLMASIAKDDELSSFDVPETARHSSGHTIYKIVLQVTPKEFTENSYQVCGGIEK